MELLADRFAPPPPASSQQPLPHALREKLPLGPYGSQISAHCHEDLSLHELRNALQRTKRRSTPGADGITYQMMRNLDSPEQECLLSAFNIVWHSGVLPIFWLLALVVPFLKREKPPTAASSFRPVSLTSAAGKLFEMIILSRLECIVRALGAIAEQQTGFRQLQCTARSIADAVSTLEEAQHMDEVAFLILVDIESAFDRLPHPTIEAALDRIHVIGTLRNYIRAFLSRRQLKVRVGNVLSSPRSVSAGVSQGGVLRQLLFNLALSGLPDSLPTDLEHSVCISVYADDVALWTREPKRQSSQIRKSLQRALDAISECITAIGLRLSTTKSEAMIFHPNPRARYRIPPLEVHGSQLRWKTQVRYLGLTIDHHLTWGPAIKQLLGQSSRVLKAIRQLLAKGRGCSHTWALRIYDAMVCSAVLYAVPLVTVKPTRWRKLEIEHRNPCRTALDLPRSSQCAGTLAEAGAWPLALRALQRALNHVERLHRAPDGGALLERLRERPHSRMGMIVRTF